MLKEADPDVAEALVAAFEKRGIKVHCGTKLKRARRTANGKRCLVRTGTAKNGMVEAEEILYALGRRPAVAGLGLKKAGVKTTEISAVKVNQSLQTSQPHIFAGGRRHRDCTMWCILGQARRNGSRKRQALTGG